MSSATRPFFKKIDNSRKILIINPTGLGDVIHTLPAARLIKDCFPEARVDFLCSAHAQDLFSLVPWIGKTFAVPEYPRPNSRWDLYRRRIRVARAIRRERYEAIISFRPEDKMIPVILLSGTKQRIGIEWIRQRNKDLRFYSEYVRRRWTNEASCQFMLNTLADAGFPAVHRGLCPSLVDLKGRSIPAEVRAPYFHLSLFTSKISRQLRPEESTQLIRDLLRRYPGHQLVLSCSAAKREVDAIHALLPSEAKGRVQVFAGTLETSDLAVLLSRAKAHLGPETGSLPLACLVGCRTVSWFMNNESMSAWVPRGAGHRVVLSVREQARLDAGDFARPIQAVSAAHILQALEELLQSAGPAPAEPPGDEVHFKFVC